MTPAYDWTRFDALRERLRTEHRAALDAKADIRVSLAFDRLRGRVADARHALENGQPVRMFLPVLNGSIAEPEVATTPDEFCDLWEQGWRP